MNIELFILLSFFVLGYSILKYIGMTGWGLVPLSFLAGVALVIVIFKIFLISGIKTGPLWVLSSVIMSSVILFVLGYRKYTRSDILYLIAGFSLIAVCTFLLHEYHLVKYHIDSFRYLDSALLISQDNFNLASMNHYMKRSLVVPALHSFAPLYGEYYVRSVTPVLSLALLGSMVWALAAYSEGSKKMIAFIAVLMIFLLVTNNRYVFNSFYINGHLIFAIYTWLAALMAWSLSINPVKQPKSIGLILFCASISVLVAVRPEGFIIASLFVALVLLSERCDTSIKSVSVLWFTVSVLMWYGYVAFNQSSGYMYSDLSLMAPFILSIILILGLVVLEKTPVGQYKNLIIFSILPFLALILLVFYMMNPSILNDSIYATYHNILLGAGSWGYSLILLLALLVFAVAINHGRALTYLWLPVLCILVVFFLLAYLRGSPYRIGNGDSLNRMLIQVVPLATFAVAMITAKSQKIYKSVGESK